MAVKKIAAKDKKEVSKKTVAMPIKIEEIKPKVVEKKALGHVKIQTAEGWKRMMKKLRTKKG